MFRKVVDYMIGAKARKIAKIGNSYYEQGNVEAALKCVEDAVQSYERSSEAYRLLSKILMPGESYLSILKQVHAELKPESYVEIGVDKGLSMKLIQPGTKAVGVDPFPQIESGNEKHAKIFKMFSDDFFRDHNVLYELGASRVSLAFIDGSHIFEQTLRDLIHIEQYSDNKTVVILHDCIAVGRVIASRKRITDLWCGDVWKLVDCLKNYRPDLNINIMAAPPSGLVFITGLDPDSSVLQDNYEIIEKEYVGKELEYVCVNQQMINAFIPSELERVRECISSVK